MPDDTTDPHDFNQPEHHEEVATLDSQIAGLAKDDLSDDEKEKLNALIDERNEAFKRNNPAPEA
jgi:hypothetical protein